MDDRGDEDWQAIQSQFAADLDENIKTYLEAMMRSSVVDPAELAAVVLGPRPISEPFPFLNHRTVKEVDEGVSGRSPTTGGSEA